MSESVEAPNPLASAPSVAPGVPSAPEASAEYRRPTYEEFAEVSSRLPESLEEFIELTRRLPDTDEVPLETPWHRGGMNLLIHILTYHWRDRRDFYVGGNMFLYYSIHHLY